jgi:GDP-D-mannose dehydratase
MTNGFRSRNFLGRFVAGVGRVIVHNSPVRGETFVTRKITRTGALEARPAGLPVPGQSRGERDWATRATTSGDVADPAAA